MGYYHRKGGHRDINQSNFFIVLVKTMCTKEKLLPRLEDENGYLSFKLVLYLFHICMHLSFHLYSLLGYILTATVLG